MVKVKIESLSRKPLLEMELTEEQFEKYFTDEFKDWFRDPDIPNDGIVSIILSRV